MSTRTTPIHSATLDIKPAAHWLARFSLLSLAFFVLPGCAEETADELRSGSALLLARNPKLSKGVLGVALHHGHRAGPCVSQAQIARVQALLDGAGS
jgi:hypothetical protein